MTCSGHYVTRHVAPGSSGLPLTLPVGWQAQVKWPRLTGDVETSEEQGKTRRSLYLSQSRVSIDHLIQHRRQRQTFIIGVSGDLHSLSLSRATHCPLQLLRNNRPSLPLHDQPDQTASPQPACLPILQALLRALEPQLEFDLDSFEADRLLQCDIRLPVRLSRKHTKTTSIATSDCAVCIGRPPAPCCAASLDDNESAVTNTLAPSADTDTDPAPSLPSVPRG